MKTVQLTIGKNEVPLKGYIHDYDENNTFRNIRPGIVICPGGAYEFISPREKDPVALYYFALGYNVFILDYSTKENAKDLNPLLELSEAFSKIREFAVPFRTNPAQVAVMGFSAGGHLAGSLALLAGNEEIEKLTGISDGSNCPDAAILCYPVVSTGEMSHRESIKNVTGGDSKLIELLSLENQVHKDACPFFIWHTQTDEAVSIKNSLSLVNALVENEVSCEFHMFPQGEHGLSMCNAECNKVDLICSQWKKLSVNWLESIFGFTTN